jgi:hypothetical protein
MRVSENPVPKEARDAAGAVELVSDAAKVS